MYVVGLTPNKIFRAMFCEAVLILLNLTHSRCVLSLQNKVTRVQSDTICDSFIQKNLQNYPFSDFKYYWMLCSPVNVCKTMNKRVAEGDASNPHDFTTEISALDKSKISIFVYVNLLPLQTRMA